MKLGSVLLTLALFVPTAVPAATTLASNWTVIKKVCVDRDPSCVSAHRRILRIAQENHRRSAAAHAAYRKEYDEFHRRSAEIDWEAFRRMEEAFKRRYKAQVTDVHALRLSEINELLKRIPEVARHPLVVRYELLTGTRADLRSNDVLAPLVRSITFPGMNLRREYECLDDARRKDPSPLKFEDTREDGYLALIVDFTYKGLVGAKAGHIEYRIVESLDRNYEVRPTYDGDWCTERDRQTD